MITCISSLLFSSHAGILLFFKYYQQTLENLKSLLGSGGALVGHLFECYVHFPFAYGDDDTLMCQSLEGLHPSTHLKRDLMHPPPGDDVKFPLKPKQHNVVVFDSVPTNLSDDYYVPLSPYFPAVDALTKEIMLQYTVSETHPIQSV